MKVIRSVVMNLYDELAEKLKRILEKEQLMEEDIVINAKTLTAKEAIGDTKRKDFPILTGKEVMLEAEFRGAIGQSFTSYPASYKGTLKEVLSLDIQKDQHATGIFIAALNAIMKHLNLIEGTIHCKNEEPERCGEKFREYIRKNYGNPKITLIGYQPAMLENLSSEFTVRVLDLDEQNIGKRKHGVMVEHGIEAYQEAVLEWSDIVLCTGSTIANGSIVNFLDIGKPVIFYGTTIAGAATLLNLDRACFFPG